MNTDSTTHSSDDANDQHRSTIRSTGTQRRFRAAIATVGLAALGLSTLAACSSSKPSGNGVASAAEVSGGRSTATTGAPKDPQLVQAEWEQCMTDEGVDMEPFSASYEGGNAVGADAESDSGANQGGIMTVPDDFDQDAMDAASEVCDPILDDFDPDAGLNPEQKTAVNDYNIAIRNCMKDKGFELPPLDGDGNIVEDDSEDDTIPVFDNDEVEEANAECEREVPLPDALEEAIAESTEQ